MRAEWSWAPWALRVSDAGDALLLRPWRAESDALAIRAVWTPPARLESALVEAVDTASSHGFARVLSPLVPERALGAYLEFGMAVVEYVVALQGGVDRLAGVAARVSDVRLRPAEPSDLDDLLAIDAACFDGFWRYGLAELTHALRDDRVTVATIGSGGVVGYVTSSVFAGTCTIGRLAVDPAARRGGVASALLADAATAAVNERAFAVSLCTQEGNAASRALYARCGLAEVGERYALASRRVGQDVCPA